MESLIIQFLLREKQVTLQEIGRFTLHADVADTDEDQVYIPDGGVSFIYDPKAAPDEGLIRFVMEKTKKIRPLAASDLDSFLMLGKQFLHIGKPFTFHRIGMLSKTQQGDIIFSQELTEKLDLENRKGDPEREVGQQESIDFTSSAAPARRFKWLLPAIILFVVTGLFIVFFWMRQSDDQPSDLTKSDTATTSNSPANVSPPPSNPVTYDHILLAKRKDSTLAYALYSRLQSVSQQDSLHIAKSDTVYQITWRFPHNSIDSTKALDSARKTYAVQPVFVP